MKETLLVRVVWVIVYAVIAALTLCACVFVRSDLEAAAVLFMTTWALWVSYANRMDNEANMPRLWISR